MWSSSLPSCQEEFCPKLANPDNGNIIISSAGNLSNGTTVFVECNDGFTYNGEDDKLLCNYGVFNDLLYNVYITFYV